MSLPLSSPAQHSGRRTDRLMLLVLAATLPGVLTSTWFFGYGLLLNILIAAVLALGLEALLVKARRRDPRAVLSDYSALVTAVLFAIAVPPGSPWWLLAIGILFAIAVAKHAFGGLGQNPFNPAMCGYLLLLLSFPLDMTTWHIAGGADYPASPSSPLGWQGLLQSLGASFPFLLEDPGHLDGMTMATPLIEHKLAVNSALIQAYDEGLPLWQRQSGTGWELVNVAYLLGGLFLLLTGVIRWHIPLSILVTVALLASLFYAPGSAAVFGTPYLHLLGSATMIGAFFIATDPVSAATTPRGRLAYGVIIGIAIYSVRVWGSYLDSIAIAVLFGNFCAPLLDHALRPRIYGHGRTPMEQPGNDRP